MVHTLPFAAWLLLFLLCLVLWPDTSPLPRLIAAYLIALVIFLVHLPWYSCRRAYYRVRLYLLARERQRIERRMRELGMDPEGEKEA